MRRPACPSRHVFGVVGVSAALLFALSATAPASYAEVPGPLFTLVDAAAQRLQTADAVAASKWTTGGPIEDPARERQVIDAVTAVAKEKGVDPLYVERAFRDQIDATVAVEYALFSEWKMDPAKAPTVAPNLSESRGAIDALNQTMVAEVAAQWEWLRSSTCATELEAARTAVVGERNLDPLYQRALAYATRSYCQ